MRLANLDGRATIVANDVLSTLPVPRTELSRLRLTSAWVNLTNLTPGTFSPTFAHTERRDRGIRARPRLGPSSIRARFSP